MARNGALRPWSILFVLLVALTPACEKPELVGDDLLPPFGDGTIAESDTISIICYTERFDSIATSNVSAYMMGTFNDPVYGISEATIYTQFRPSGSISFESSAVCDSVVLTMRYAGGYGHLDKLRGVQKVGVYELKDDINDDSTYYSTVTRTMGNKLGEKTFWPDQNNGYSINGESLSPQLRIRLDNGFGQKLLFTSSDTLSTAESFVKKFKGLCIVPENGAIAQGNGAIIYFNMVDAQTRVELYYHNAVSDSLKYTFDINSKSATHMRFTHQYPAQLEAIFGDTTQGGDKLYLQSMAGTKVRVKFPHIEKLRELGPIAINKAEIYFPISEGSYSTYGSSPGLQLVNIRDSVTSTFITDYYETAEHYDGTFNATEGHYKFNIGRHMQELINGDHNPANGLYLLNSGNAVNANRNILNGYMHPDKPVRMRLIFTRVNL